MQKVSARESRRNLLVSLIVLGIIGAFIFTPFYFRAEAGKNQPAEKTASRETDLKNYDIRLDKNEAARNAVVSFRSKAGKDAVRIADAKDEIVVAEKRLRQEVPNLKVEYNPVIFSPEVITPTVNLKQKYLTAASGADRAEILRSFISENNELVGLNGNQPAELEAAADYTNPDGNLSFVRLEQKINEIPVFQGEIKAGFTKRGEIIRVINNLAPGLDAQSVSNNFGDPSDAVKAAALSINHQLRESDLTQNPAASDELKTIFGSSDEATAAVKTYFPVEPGVARAAWGVLIWQPENAYYSVVDAETGKLLWRKNITSEQTQAVTYNVYANTGSMLKVLDSPTAGTPGPFAPGGAAGIFQNRTDVTLVGNEAPYTFNNLGWIADGGNSTDGNNVIAGPDRNTTNGVDAAIIGSGNRVFNFNYNPGPGNPTPGEAPLPAGASASPCVASPPPTNDFQKGISTQLFYIANRYHDEMYLLGFNEQAGNFQINNFGRGGNGNDRILAESQDCAGTNNANFATPPDGFSGRMQMYIFTVSTPNRDGSLDADVVVHELTHGLSNRLHGNALGLSSNMAGGMGEGWSDFYALALLSEPTDPANGVYPAGAYVTNNSYYGIRRFPFAVKSAVDASNRSYNPMTFADIDTTQRNLNDGAFSPRFTGTADEVHNAGEIWATVLWEARARFVNRLGWQTGNRRFLQFVTDGMKLSPINPTFLQGRDAIIAAARAANIGGNSSQDVIDIWEGFRIRGMGFSAKVTALGSGSGDARVVEAFDVPNVSLAANTPISDAAPGGDGDGIFEPGETLTLTASVTNNSGTTINNVIVSVAGGGTANFGSLADNQTASQTVSYTVPANTVCGSQKAVTINVSSSVGQYAETRNIIIGQASVTLTEKFDGAAAPALPNGWISAQTGVGSFWKTTTATADSAPNSVFTPNTTSAAGGADLESPGFNITSEAAVLKFRQYYNTEQGWDGGVLEISINNGAYQDIIAAGGTFIEGGYNGALGVNQNPLDGRAAWTGNSGTFVTARVLLPAAAKNQSVKFKWRFGQDTNTAPANGGWYVDTLELLDTYNCSFNTSTVQATVGTNPAGLSFTVDGVSYTSAQTFTWTPGSSHTIGTTSPQGGSQTRYNWNNWSDGGAVSHTVAPTANANYTASFTTQHFLTMNAAAGGSVSPQSGWYNAGQSVQITAAPISGFIFGGWTGTGTGSYTGANNPATVTVSSPITQNASFSAQCSYAINPVSANAAAAGGAGSFNLTANAGCNWTAQSNAAWITTSSSGSGNGTISYVVTANSAASSRTGTISVGGQTFTITQTAATTTADKIKMFDYDGDGLTDISIYRPSMGEWWYLRSSDGANRAFAFGSATDKIVPADFTGDGKTDIAFWRPSSGEWFVIRSEDNSYYAFPFGEAGDIPAAGDFDGDGKADAAVFRPSTQVWYISKSTGGSSIQQFGSPGDVPVVADYDGDKRADIAIFRPAVAEWWIQKSSGGSLVYQFGAAGDKPAQADYTGDGKADVAFFRPSSGEWFVIRSENESFYSAPFGEAGDVPAAGDYDGDKKADFAVYRPSTNAWYLNRSRDGNVILSFGQAGDVPTASAFVPKF